MSSSVSPGHADDPVHLGVDARLPAVLEVLTDRGRGVALLLQAQGVFGEGIDAKAQGDEAGLAQLLEIGQVAFLVDAQLAGKLDLEAAADDLVANLQHRLRLAVQVALVEHEQPAALLHQPFQLIHERLGRADAPVKALAQKVHRDQRQPRLAMIGVSW